MFELIKSLEIKTSMLFDLNFANNAILSCFFFLFLNYSLILFNPSSYCKIFAPIAELVILIGIPSKQAKTEIEMHPVIAEAKMRKYSI